MNILFCIGSYQRSCNSRLIKTLFHSFINSFLRMDYLNVALLRVNLATRNSQPYSIRRVSVRVSVTYRYKKHRIIIYSECAQELVRFHFSEIFTGPGDLSGTISQLLAKILFRFTDIPGPVQS